MCVYVVGAGHTFWVPGCSNMCPIVNGNTSRPWVHMWVWYEIKWFNWEKLTEKYSSALSFHYPPAGWSWGGIAGLHTHGPVSGRRDPTELYLFTGRMEENEEHLVDITVGFPDKEMEPWSIASGINLIFCWANSDLLNRLLAKLLKEVRKWTSRAVWVFVPTILFALTQKEIIWLRMEF